MLKNEKSDDTDNKKREILILLIISCAFSVHLTATDTQFLHMRVTFLID
jgi:hypothetical protein